MLSRLVQFVNVNPAEHKVTARPVLTAEDHVKAHRAHALLLQQMQPKPAPLDPVVEMRRRQLLTNIEAASEKTAEELAASSDQKLRPASERAQVGTTSATDFVAVPCESLID